MKSILVMNFFPAFFPPRSGGELRYYNMYKGLSRYYDVTLLSPTYNDHKEEVIVHSDTFREYRVPKTDIHNHLHMTIDQEEICKEISALVCYYSGQTHNRYHDLYFELYSKADIIIHDFPYMLQYDVYFGLDNKPRVYNSHNFETDLLEQMYHGPHAQKHLDAIRKAEQTLVQNCDVVFATSEEERKKLSDVFGISVDSIYLAPNGIDTALYEYERSRSKAFDRKKAFFIGSSHPPNIEAVDFIHDVLAPKCPQVDFYIAGKCGMGRTSAYKNVFFMGMIDEEQKDDLFTTSDVALNPMFSGAGTNLKTLEFLSAGIPMVSTAVGVRGLDLVEGKQYAHAEKEDFVEVLNELLNDQSAQNAYSVQGKEFVNSRYSWDIICENVHKAIESKQETPGQKTNKLKTILIINDYAVNNPISGGEVRVYNLFKSISKHYRVIYLCQNTGEVKKEYLNENFIHISLPKTKKHIELENKTNSQFWISANDIIAGHIIKENRMFMHMVETLGSQIDLLVLEHPFMIDAIKNLPDVPVIYESQNFEYKLKKDLLQYHPMKDFLVGEVKRMEEETIIRADRIVSCSADEVEAFRSFTNKKDVRIDVVRNGVEFVQREYEYAALKKLFDTRPVIVFVGSGHAPNVDAADFIINQLAGQVLDAVFMLIGSVCDCFAEAPTPPNVILMGRLDEKYLNYILFSADVALNPVDQGAGSNLKLAEYFAYGVPTITTPFGARGYSVRNGEHAIVTERAGFKEALHQILGNHEHAVQMARNAYQYAKNELDWEKLACLYLRSIEEVLGKKRLLAVTYRYNMPPRGGAEVYLHNVLSRIAQRGNYAVDVVTTDIGDIQNQFHYSCAYSKDSCSCWSDEDALRVIKFPVDELPVHEKWEKSRLIHMAMNQESREIARRFVWEYSFPLLMGGWYFPEGEAIWSSDSADIFVGSTCAVKITAYANKKKRVNILLDGKKIKSENIKDTFCWTIDCGQANILTIQTEGFSIENEEARFLGLFINEIQYEAYGEMKKLDFVENYKQFLKTNTPEAYVNALIQQAEKRDEQIEQMFYETRGPVSSKLCEWMKANVGKYTAVIGHSTPFDTLVDAQRIAKENNVRCLLLPHFHMEDDFYHWRTYYRALQEADHVFAAPKASKELFYDRIGANAIDIPGGGVNLKEYSDVDVAEFRKHYQDLRPFILVLGRKAGGKNYQWIIEAAEKLNRDRNDIRVVMIGRDDDKQEVHSKCVTYLGEQSRNTVLGALKECAFVVNMSESESFGIVILEAWLSGKTVIANRGCLAFSELVSDGENGILTTREELDRAILNLLNNPDKDRMAESGRNKAKEYDWTSIANKMEVYLSAENG